MSLPSEAMTSLPNLMAFVGIQIDTFTPALRRSAPSALVPLTFVAAGIAAVVGADFQIRRPGQRCASVCERAPRKGGHLGLGQAVGIAVALLSRLLSAATTLKGRVLPFL